jgi:hypothetical protein
MYSIVLESTDLEYVLSSFQFFHIDLRSTSKAVPYTNDYYIGVQNTFQTTPYKTLVHALG